MKNKKTIILFLIFCFLTVLIVISSVLFSVQNVYGSCYNADDSDIVARVSDREIHGIKDGTNIFLIKEDKVVRSIEEKIPNVKVVNIERKFPSTVYINFVVLEEYFQIQFGDQRLYVSNESKVLRAENNTAEFDDGHIVLYCGANPDSTSVGSYLFSPDSSRYAIIFELASAMAKLGYNTAQTIEIFKQIDLRFLDQNLLFIRTKAGVAIEVQSPNNGLTTKMQLAMSKLNSSSYEEKSNGTIIVSNSGNKVSGSYSSKDRYGEKLQELTSSATKL